MMKHPNRKTVSKHDMIRTIEGLVQHVQISSLRMDDIERILSDYIEYVDSEKKFGEYLDGKYKSKESDGSGTNSSPSKE